MAARRRRTRTRREKTRHTVAATLRQDFTLTLEGSALDLIIRSDGHKLGRLGIGRGSITWKGRSDKRALPLNWTQFIALLEEERRRRVSRRD